MKHSDKLLFGQLYILQSKIENIFKGGCIPRILDASISNEMQKLEISKSLGKNNVLA